MTRRVWRALGRLVKVVHETSGLNPFWERDPVPEDLDRAPVMIVGGICLGVSVFVVVRLLDDFVFATAAITALIALRHLAATHLRVLAGWALTFWSFNVLLLVASWAVYLPIHALLSVL
jgi:hypothetical protein